jgi:hypothetical protein
MKIAIALNVLVVALELWAMINGLTRRGPEALIYYTTLSNLFGLIACVVCLVAEIRVLRGESSVSHSAKPLEDSGSATLHNGSHSTTPLRIPRWAMLLKYSSSCCLLMTLCVVVFVLAPAYNAAGYNGYYLMFCERELPVTHLLGPVLVFVSYVLFEADRPITLRQSFYGLLPTLMYAAVAYPCNIARIWEGPYPFFFVWEMHPLHSVAWFFGLCIMAFCLCQVPRLIGNKLSKRR